MSERDRGDVLGEKHRRSQKRRREHSPDSERRVHRRSRSCLRKRRTAGSSERWISRRSREGGDSDDGTSSKRHRQVARRGARSQERGRSRRSREVSVTTASQLGDAIVEGMAKFAHQFRVKDNNPLVSVNTVTNNLISEFNPLIQNVNEWLESVDEYAYIYRWDDKIICHLALSKLRGPAEVWYRGYPRGYLNGPNGKRCCYKTLGQSVIYIRPYKQ